MMVFELKLNNAILLQSEIIRALVGEDSLATVERESKRLSCSCWAHEPRAKNGCRRWAKNGAKNGKSHRNAATRRESATTR
jgi:hypothetical protein